ncbi:MAG: hypothetical protein C4576_19675 [Desulfobacteraceae bacterium]|nr:MAG: hypothetical protein C4576_19675 [Desulfobacteraceae bacterium]
MSSSGALYFSNVRFDMYSSRKVFIPVFRNAQDSLNLFRLKIHLLTPQKLIAYFVGYLSAYVKHFFYALQKIWPVVFRSTGPFFPIWSTLGQHLLENMFPFSFVCTCSYFIIREI